MRCKPLFDDFDTNPSFVNQKLTGKALDYDKFKQRPHARYLLIDQSYELLKDPDELKKTISGEPSSINTKYRELYSLKVFQQSY
jgi:hypothetical protein